MNTNLLVIGLGNPGKQYHKTRHNVGFHVIDELARRSDAVFRNKKSFNYAWASFPLGELFLCKPTTYMNDSGRVFPAVFSQARTTREKLLVVTDNADLPTGKIRLKPSGGQTTHNGIRSIVAALGDGNFMRLYIGIGTPPFSLHAHVLSRWSRTEDEIYARSFSAAANAVLELTQHPVETVQGNYN